MATVLLDKRSDGVGLITLNRPDSLNAMGEDLLPRLAEALEDCAADAAVRCVAITGAGRAFCAGGDVKGMAAGNARSAEGASKAPSIDAQIEGLWNSELATSHQVYTMPKPTVALLNGVAAGGGMSLALACDMRVASDKARLVTAFRNVGLGGDYGMNYLLPRFVGPGRARELLFRGENLNVQEAHELGVVNRIIPHESFMDEALTYCADGGDCADEAEHGDGGASVAVGGVAAGGDEPHAGTLGHGPSRGRAGIRGEAEAELPRGVSPRAARTAVGWGYPASDSP